jgi:hypothetical protein
LHRWTAAFARQADRGGADAGVAQVTNFAVRFFPIFLACYFGQGVTVAAANALPAAVVGILGMFGTLLPLVGFAMLLNTIVRKKTDLLFYIFGSFSRNRSICRFCPRCLSVRHRVSGRAHSVPARNRRMLKPPIRIGNACSRSGTWSAVTGNGLIWHLSAQNMERMQAPALVRMLAAVREKLYPNDPERQQRLLQRHTPFFNTEPYVAVSCPASCSAWRRKTRSGAISPRR